MRIYLFELFCHFESFPKNILQKLQITFEGKGHEIQYNVLYVHALQIVFSDVISSKEYVLAIDATVIRLRTLLIRQTSRSLNPSYC
jgi:hypothetical protein